MTANKKGHAPTKSVTQNDRGCDCSLSPAERSRTTEQMHEALERLLGRPVSFTEEQDISIVFIALRELYPDPSTLNEQRHRLYGGICLGGGAE